MLFGAHFNEYFSILFHWTILMKLLGILGAPLEQNSTYFLLKTPYFYVIGIFIKFYIFMIIRKKTCQILL